MSRLILSYYGDTFKLQQRIGFSLLLLSLIMLLFVVIIEIGCFIETSIISEHIRNILIDDIFQISVDAVREQRTEEYNNAVETIKNSLEELDLMSTAAEIKKLKDLEAHLYEEYISDIWGTGNFRHCLKEYADFLCNKQICHGVKHFLASRWGIVDVANSKMISSGCLKLLGELINKQLTKI